jgi:hypothetical protein
MYARKWPLPLGVLGAEAREEVCIAECIIKLTSIKKKFRTHVIKLDIAPVSYPLGQYLLVSASNNMLYYLSQ